LQGDIRAKRKAIEERYLIVIRTLLHSVLKQAVQMTKPYDAQSASPTARVVIDFQPDNGVFNGNGDFLDDVLGKNPAGRNAIAQNGRFEMSCGKDGKS